MNTQTDNPPDTTPAARYQRAYRDRQRGGPPREPKPCGHHATFERHKKNGEPIDDACRLAHNQYMSLSRFIRIAREQMDATDDPAELEELQARINELEAERVMVR